MGRPNRTTPEHIRAAIKDLHREAERKRREELRRMSGQSQELWRRSAVDTAPYTVRHLDGSWTRSVTLTVTPLARTTHLAVGFLGMNCASQPGSIRSRQLPEGLGNYQASQLA